MNALQNLDDAVTRIKPRVILVLDTNVIMKFPWLDRLKISSSGPFLLVVPTLVDGELMRLRKDKDERTRKRASLAHWFTSKLYEQGKPHAGVDLGDDRWLITVSAPASGVINALDDQQTRSDKGMVDAALLRMTAACTRDFSDASTLFVTEEHDLRRRASTLGLSACQLSDLRSSETFENIFRETRPNEELNIEDAIIALVDPKNKRTIKIAVTLEELKSETDNLLVARGSGQLTYEGKRFPFRWMFPYQNQAIYNRLSDDIPESSEYAEMPLENVDFMGADDEIPEGVRRYVCSMLEGAYESQDLQSPITKVRASMLFNTFMGITRGGTPFDYPLSEEQKQGKEPEDAERYEELRISHNQHVSSLYDGSAKSMSEAYRSAFQLSENLDSFWDGIIDDEYDEFNWNVELSLIEFLDEALGAWSVGETREAEYTHTPFPSLEDDEESSADDEEEVGEETE